jgi:hypothetical protein
MGNEYLIYLQEILDTSWVVELISEQFDDAINMMTTDSIIYGGAVRDCLAGKTLLGDLDIIVPSAEHHILINKFIQNPKWLLINRTQKGREREPFNPFLPVNNNHSYENSKISGITSFKTLGDKIVQIVELPTTDDTPFQSAVRFVKQVDIVCCGVILTNNGRVFEVVPNAYNDCKKNILCLNTTFNINNIEGFQSRIKKLVAREWHNAVDMNQVVKTVKKKQKIFNQTEVKDISIIKFRYAKTKSTTMNNNNGYELFISNKDLIHIGKRTETFSRLGRMAKRYLLDIIIHMKFYGIVIKCVNQATADFVYKKIFNTKKRSSPFNKETHINWETEKVLMPKKSTNLRGLPPSDPSSQIRTLNKKTYTEWKTENILMSKGDIE